MNVVNKSYWDKLPEEIQIKIINYSKKLYATIKIQNMAYKKFYNKYGIKWKENLHHYQDNYDYYCYRNGITDPCMDYYNYYYNDYNNNEMSKYDFP